MISFFETKLSNIGYFFFKIGDVSVKLVSVNWTMHCRLIFYYNNTKLDFYLFLNSSFNGFPSAFDGWASTEYFDRNVFITQLDHIESLKLTSESCSVIHRGQLYVYGQGLKYFLRSFFSTFSLYQPLYLLDIGVNPSFLWF